MDSGIKCITITQDKYGTGEGVFQIYVRGSTIIFDYDAVTPAWEEYSGPRNVEWNYIQVKLEGL